MAVLVDGAGLVYIADTGNNVVRVVDAAGIISTYAGQYYAPGTAPPAVCAAATDSVGDGCPSDQMIMNTPTDLVFCHAGNLHVSDRLNNRVRTISRITRQAITQVGSGVAGYNGDGELNTSAELDGPTGMAMDAANYIYVADSGNHIVRKTLLTGTTPNPIATVAGTPGSAGSAGDGLLATRAQLLTPRGVGVDAAGDLYISDVDGHVVRKVNAASGLISTLAGTGTAGYGGDGGLATGALLGAPSGLLVDEAGNLFIAYAGDGVVREVDVADGPSLSFAATTAGATSAPQDVTLMNLGDSPATIGGIGAPAGYSLGGADTSCNLSGAQTLAPAASCVLGIEFTPMTVGSVRGDIVLTDGGNATISTIALSGTATAPQAETYALAATPPAVSMTAGTRATATLTLASINFAGTVSFATSIRSTDGTPADMTASAPPVTLTAGGTGTSTVTLSASATAANDAPGSPLSGGAGVSLAALLGVPLAFRRRRRAAGLPVGLAVALATILAACGGAATSSMTRSARPYLVTVTPTGPATPAGPAATATPAAVSIQVTVQ